MSISFSDNNKRETIFEPLLSRQRFIYKGPVTSYAMNLFDDQFFMDVNRLYEKIKLLENQIDDSTSISRNDLNLATPDYYLNEEILMTIRSQQVKFDENTQDYIVESTIPSYNSSLTFQKPQLNSATISQLRRKLDLIEEAMRDDN